RQVKRGWILLALCGCATAAPAWVETVEGIEMVYVSGDSRLRPFWISTRVVTWEEFDRFYESPEEQRVDGITRPSSGKNYLQLSGLPAESMEPERPGTNPRFPPA